MCVCVSSLREGVTQRLQLHYIPPGEARTLNLEGEPEHIYGLLASISTFDLLDTCFKKAEYTTSKLK